MRMRKPSIRHLKTLFALLLIYSFVSATYSQHRALQSSDPPVVAPPVHAEPEPPQNRTPPLGFYILRHMSCNDSMEFRHICFTRIRRLYANIPIVIIDDNSPRDLVENGTNQKREKEARLDNTRIESYPEYPGRGELLPYYAFQKNHPFEKAVFLHDTTFLNGKPVDFDAVEEAGIHRKKKFALPLHFQISVRPFAALALAKRGSLWGKKVEKSDHLCGYV